MRIENVTRRYIARQPYVREKSRGVSWFLNHFDYDPDSGKLYYKQQGAHPNNVPGKEVKPTRVYRHQNIIFWKGKEYQAARVAYICMTKKIPHLVLPKDGNISNLKWSNLLHLNPSEDALARTQHSVDVYTYDLTKIKH